MWVLLCVACDATVSGPLREGTWRGDEDLPGLPHQIAGLLPARMIAGSFAVHPNPPTDRGLSDPRGNPGAADTLYVLNPGDTSDTVLLIDSGDDGCVGITGSGGPNVACARCGSRIGFRIDDCGTWQETLLLAAAVRRIEVAETAVPDAIHYPQVESSLVDCAHWRHGDLVHDFERAEVAGPGLEPWFGESGWRDEVERAQQNATELLDEPPLGG